MFTSEPSLIQRIERMILETPIIDVDTQLQPGRLSAPNLFGLLEEPSLQAELVAVGMAPGDLAPSISEAERIRKVIPFLGRIRNTAAAWCFHRILRDLHDFYDSNLTEENAAELIAKTVRAGDDPTWGPTLLRDRCNLQLAAASLEGESQGASAPAGTPQLVGVVDIDSFLTGQLPAPDLKTRLLAELDRSTSGDVRRLFRVSLSALTAGSAATGTILAIARSLLAWHDERGKTLRIVVGSGNGLERLAPDWAESLAANLQEFRKARFDLVAGTDTARDGACRLAARLPQVYASASWRDNYSAASIADFIARQVHQVPKAKLTAFNTGASTAEWVYGKQQLARKAIASGFARLIEGGYYEEDEVPAMLRSLLHDTPSELYS